MSILYEFPNYTSEQLEEAKKSMRKSQAYRLASEYYSILNYNKEFNNHRIDIEKRDKYQKEVEQRTSSELEERDGYRKYLGSELLPSTDVEFEKKLKKALIIVDDDFRNGNGDIDFMARFASILPKPFLNMVFVLSINNHNDEMLSAISRNELENILEFDNMLLKEYPDLRLKAINSGVVYPSILLDYAMVEINGGLTTDFTHAADIYTLLNSEQRADNGLFMKIKMDCFDAVQVHCQDIAQYQRNKQIFFEKVLKVKRGKESNLSEMIGNVPKCQLEKSPVLCPMDYAVERFLDFFLLPEVYNGDGEYRNSNDELEDWADRIVEIDIEERKVSLEKYFQFHKEQPINRTAKEAAALKYANDIVRGKIADVKTAKKYIEMHKKDGDLGYIDPNETTMQMIMKEYGNAPEIKELLFADCYKLNHLWDVIPYDSIPDDYTIYEKMMAGTQILATDFSRIDEIPDDIRARIFDSKDCITRILFPGLQYQSEFGSAAGKLELGYYSRGIKPERLLIQVLGKMSSRLKEAGYIDEIRKMYDMYNVSHISFFKSGIDWVTLQSVLTLNELPAKPKPLAEVFGLTPIDDNLSEFIVEDEEEKSVPDSDYYSTYDLNESHKAKELLTIPQSIQIIKAYYKANKYLIGDIKSKGLSNYEDKDYIRQEAIDGSRLLAQETRLVGRGEFVRMAAINIDNMLFKGRLDNIEEFDSLREFVKENAAFLPNEFLSNYNRLLSIMGQKTIGISLDEIAYKQMIRDCRKYTQNTSYRTNIPFDITELAKVINRTSIKDEDLGRLFEKDYKYLLYAMISYYSKASFENSVQNYYNYRANYETTLLEEIEQAAQKSIDLILGVIPKMDNLNWNVILSGNRAISNNSFYPLPSRLIGSLMEKLYSSSSRKEELRSSETDINAGQRLRDTISLKIQSSNTIDKLLFRNIKPDEFLKWDMMEQFLLEQAIVIMGKNDIEVLKTLDAVVHNEDGSLLAKANPNLSKEEISRFKTRLIDVYDSIFTSKNDKHRIALVTPPTDFQGLPNHKQPVDEYMNELYKLLTREQIFKIDMLEALHKDYNSDYRCAQWSRKDFENLIMAISIQKLKEEQRKKNLGGIEDKKNGHPHENPQ